MYEPEMVALFLHWSIYNLGTACGPHYLFHDLSILRYGLVLIRGLLCDEFFWETYFVKK